jgi:hypothetical protein
VLVVTHVYPTASPPRCAAGDPRYPEAKVLDLYSAFVDACHLDRSLSCYPTTCDCERLQVDGVHGTAFGVHLKATLIAGAILKHYLPSYAFGDAPRALLSRLALPKSRAPGRLAPPRQQPRPPKRLRERLLQRRRLPALAGRQRRVRRENPRVVSGIILGPTRPTSAPSRRLPPPRARASDAAVRARRGVRGEHDWRRAFDLDAAQEGPALASVTAHASARDRAHSPVRALWNSQNSSAYTPLWRGDLADPPPLGV